MRVSAGGAGRGRAAMERLDGYEGAMLMLCGPFLGLLSRGDVLVAYERELAHEV